MRLIEVSAVLLLAVFTLQEQTGAETPPPSDSVKKGKLHAPAEIMKILEDSALTYELDLDDNLTPERIEAPRILSDEMLLLEADGGYSLTSYSLTEEAKSRLASAEKSYEQKDYDAALKGYARLRESHPSYWHALVLIGDAHYAMGDHDKARRAFEEAIKHNFADYQAHWFLGDTLWKLGDKPGAIRCLTIAHLLNVNHKVLRDKLLSYRAATDRPWNDWAYEPRYSVRKEGDRIKVTFATEWLGYAIVKAVWAFEPGYAHDMVGPDYERNAITIPEEKEALAAVLASNPGMEHLSKIINDGYATEFILYELLARRAPEAIVLLPRDTFGRVVDYVNTYH